MYPEFIAIYIGLVVIIGLLVAILAIVLKQKSETTTTFTSNRQSDQTHVNTFVSPTPSTTNNVVFCKKCGTQLDGSTHICPKCGTQR